MPSWPLALDIVLDRDQGPMLLEANARPGLAIQIANGRGLMPRLEAIDEKLEAKPTIISLEQVRQIWSAWFCAA